MKTQILISIFCLSILFSCSEEDLCLTGSGQVETHELQTSAFENVTIYGPVNLRFRQSNSRTLTVVAEPEMYRNLSHTVINNTLFIGIEGNVRCFNTEYGIWIDVSAPNINYIKSQGMNEIVSDGPIYQDRIKIVTEGDATLQLSGVVREQVIAVSGALNAKNFDLQTERTVIKVEGSGDFEISCSDELDIDVRGSATVLYKGAPTIKVEKDGSLSLHKIE